MENINQEVFFVLFNLVVISFVYLFYTIKHHHVIEYDEPIVGACMLIIIVSVILICSVPNQQQIGCLINKNSYGFDLINDVKDSSDYVLLDDYKYKLNNSDEEIGKTIKLFENDSISGYYTMNRIAMFGITHSLYLCTKQKYDSLKALGYKEFIKK